MRRQPRAGRSLDASGRRARQPNGRSSSSWRGNYRGGARRSTRDAPPPLAQLPMTAQSWRALRRQLVRLAGHEARELIDAIAVERCDERIHPWPSSLAREGSATAAEWSRPRVFQPAPTSQPARERVPWSVWDAVWAYLDQQDLLVRVERTCREWREGSTRLGLGWRDKSFGGAKLTALRLVVLGRRLAHVRGTVALEAPSADAQVYYERHLGRCTGARLYGNYADVLAATQRVAAANYAAAECRRRAALASGAMATPNPQTHPGLVLPIQTTSRHRRCRHTF